VTIALGAAARRDLEQVLLRSRQLGFLGPGPVADHVDHALRFALALDLAPEGGVAVPVQVADLGAGGGVPGLPVLLACPGVQAVLIDSSQRRCAFLVWATVELGLAGRADVLCARAEVVAHDPAWRESFDAVLARGFGSPSTTVECGGPLLRRGGRCAVSEPPGGREWPAGGLRRAGLREVGTVAGVVVLERAYEIGPELPRPMKEQRHQPLLGMT
jgi:16S rRNA (guanine527-N7)-methyltransferase